MCGRYALYTAPQKLKDLFGTDNLIKFGPRYNVGPLQELPVIVKNRMGTALWGFSPPWAQEYDKTFAAKMMNARSETIAEKASFKESWTRGRRCLIPANGFYEWKQEPETKTKTAYYVHNPDHETIAFAGLWSKMGQFVTFTILTKKADGPTANIHHRMPVMLLPEQTQEWFYTDIEQAQKLIEKCSASTYSLHTVSPDIGNIKNDHAGLIEPQQILKQSSFAGL